MASLDLNLLCLCLALKIITMFIIIESEYKLKREMDYLSNLDLIHKIADSILSQKKSVYSDDPIYLTLQTLPQIGLADPAVYNRHKQKLKVSLFYHHSQLRKTCIVFMHGFGSNRIQAINILPYLPKSVSLCCFDFSAEGKSQGRQVTYGHKQKDDIRAILGYLRSCKYDNFILWGRSMGATSTLLFSIYQKPQDVILQILDSPYSSFAEVAMQLTKKKINIPDIILTMALEALRKNCQNKEFNPFKVDLNFTINCSIPSIFVFSQNDDVINCKNSHQIISNFNGHYEKLIIKQNHNVIRTSKTIKKIIQLIKQYGLKKYPMEIDYKKSSLIHFNNENSSRKIEMTEGMFDNYGIWVSSKFQKPHKAGNKKIVKLVNSQNFYKQRPKSSIKVMSANLSMRDISIQKNSMQSKKEVNDNKKLTQSTVSRSTSHSVSQKIKRFGHLTHQLYL